MIIAKHAPAGQACFGHLHTALPVSGVSNAALWRMHLRAALQHHHIISLQHAVVVTVHKALGVYTHMLLVFNRIRIMFHYFMHACCLLMRLDKLASRCRHTQHVFLVHQNLLMA